MSAEVGSGAEDRVARIRDLDQEIAGQEKIAKAHRREEERYRKLAAVTWSYVWSLRDQRGRLVEDAIQTLISAEPT